MPTNIEIKARAHDFERQQNLAARIADGPVEVLVQEDTFYQVKQGRLKLRVLGPARGELIYYEREDRSGPKSSHYRVFPTQKPEALHTALTRVLDTVGTVKKTRHLYHRGQTRIHLDDVEGLGLFLELEVVLRDDQSAAEGQAIATELMQALEVREMDLIASAYLDLLSRSPGTGVRPEKHRLRPKE